MNAMLLLAEGAEGPNTELLWILGILMAFFVLSILLGWVASARGEKPAGAVQEAHSSEQAEEVEEKKKPEAKVIRKKKSS